MLLIEDANARCSRRELLTVGGLAWSGMSLASVLNPAVAFGSTAAHRALLTGKSVIFLFQQGGASQFETFDPKPDAPSGIRTVTDTIQTSIPGISFGDSLPQLARLASKLTIVRSFQSGNAGHNLRPLVAPETRNANLGAYYSRVAGSLHPETAMPTGAVLLPQSVDGDVAKGQGRGDLLATGTLGSAYAPFVPGGTNQMLQNMRLSLPVDRLQDRRELQSRLDQLGRRYESESQFENHDRQQQQACEVLLSGSVAEALDLSREPTHVIDQYDTARYVASHGWKRANRGKAGYYTGHAKSLGKSLLLARRLCEAGCGFVTVHCGYEGVWDMHADGNNLNMVDGMQAVGFAFDHAVAALIQDLEDRGLTDRILVVATGEMGRTPRLNKNGGRDHWARLTPLMIHGGGTVAGNVIGQSTRDGGEPISDPIPAEQLNSTILQTALKSDLLRLQPSLNAVGPLMEPAVIPGLF